MSSGDSVNSRAKATLLLGFCSSLVMHGIAYASLASRELEPPTSPVVSTVSFEVEAPPPVEPPPTSKLPEAPALHGVSPAPAHAPEPKAPLAPPTVAPPEPKSGAPLDLSGVTLTNDTGTGFAMPVGDGSGLRGPIGVAGNRLAPGPTRAQPIRGPGRPLLVAAGDLSEHPRPPALEGLLRANYPEEARQRGLRGTASVRARIDADGVIRFARLVSESSAGFGAACQRTVIGSHWSAPRAQNGDAVATEIVYTCHFEVD